MEDNENQLKESENQLRENENLTEEIEIPMEDSEISTDEIEYQAGENLEESSHELLSSKTFNFELFCYFMKKSFLKDSDEVDDVNLETYLLAYEQLHNFFLLLGTAFQFVALDVKSKIKILKSYQKKEKEASNSSKNFLTVKSMVDYEEKNNLLTNSKYVSGSRTLLRLHRGLDFVRKFLDEIYKLRTDAKLCDIAVDVYNQTLAEYHSWVVRNAARMAMKMLPTRTQLLKQMTDNNSGIKLNQTLEIFPDAIEAMNVVYDTIQSIYAVNKLLDLP